ncbi:unnamed protein product [Microthlaspi erraticum]|uniref:Pentatricopeptide repeat-containing protein n=1 Tax=Microthlaspi erraticum TaxID=1685480 RepID=A0A6D2JR94_9BRAS|nr:unnamed protein product [Microthlaspi erraticum]
MPMKNPASWNSMIGGFARHGLGADALEEFEKMMECGLERIAAEKEHYALRDGELDKAERLIKGVPFEPDVVIWGTLLGACIHVWSSVRLLLKGSRGLEEEIGLVLWGLGL